MIATRTRRCRAPTNRRCAHQSQRNCKRSLAAAFVESIDVRPARQRRDATRASAFITFNGLDRGREWLTSYCGFITGSRGGTIQDAITWLREYVRVYGEADATVVADFDAYHAYFDDVDFPIVDLATGKLAAQAFQKYANETHETIVIADKYVHVEGDLFENIANATIANRSEIRFNPLDHDNDDDY